MTNTWQWEAVHARGQTLFGDTPGAQLEQRIIDHFQRTPNRVVDLIEHIGRRIAKGANIHSGWAILATELDKQPRNTAAADTGEQAKQIALAETWIRNTGGYLDRSDELDDELFGYRGKLRHWPELKPRMHALWENQRDRFVRTEREATVRQGRQAQLLKQLRKATRDPSRDPAPPSARNYEAPAPPREKTHLGGPQSPRPLENRSDGLALGSTPPLDLAYLDSIALLDTIFPDREGDPA